MAIPTRAQWLADARAMLDMLEANPDLPIGTFRIPAYAGTGSDDTDREAVDAVAKTLGIEAVVPPRSRHYQAAIAIGSALYEFTAVPTASMHRYHRVNKLGEAALAAEEATA
jgi:hypothetical protein